MVRHELVMKPAQAIFFDLDETLVDGSSLQRSIVAACGEIAAKHPELDPAALVAANQSIWPDYSRELIARWELGAIDCESLRLGAWRLTLRACGCADEAIVQFAMEAHSRVARETYRLFDDTHGLFASLRKSGIPLALITNGGSMTQREKLNALGIDQWFDAVVISGEIGVAKPDAAAFRFALDKLVVEPERVWHVGDDLKTDVAGAKAARITAVWLNRRGLVRRESDPQADLEILSLSSLVPHFSE